MQELFPLFPFFPLLFAGYSAGGLQQGSKHRRVSRHRKERGNTVSVQYYEEDTGESFNRWCSTQEGPPWRAEELWGKVPRPRTLLWQQPL